MSVSLTGSAIYYNGSELPTNTSLGSYGFSSSQYKKSNNLGTLHYNNSSSNKCYLAGYRASTTSNSFITKLTYKNDKVDGDIITGFSFNITTGVTSNFNLTPMAVVISTANYTKSSDFYSNNSLKDFGNYAITKTIGTTNTSYTFNFSNIEISSETFYVYLVSSKVAATTWTLIKASPTISVTYKQYQYTIEYYLNNNLYLRDTVSGTSSSINYTITPYPDSVWNEFEYGEAIYEYPYTVPGVENTWTEIIYEDIENKTINWNTNRNGTGTSYGEYTQIEVSSNLILYAIQETNTSYWVELLYYPIDNKILKYNLLANIFGDVSLKYTQDVTVEYGTLKWCTENYDYEVNIDGSWYQLEPIDVPNRGGTITLTAKYDEHYYGDPFSLPTNLVREGGITFRHWSETPNGAPISYPDQYYPTNQNQTVYAVWSGEPPSLKEGMYIYTNNAWRKVASIATK